MACSDSSPVPLAIRWKVFLTKTTLNNYYKVNECSYRKKIEENLN